MALEEFKRNNPAWSRINCILIDKDFGEISVLKKALPDARLLLCQFHVLKYLREQIASKDYGFTSWQKQQLDGLMNLLVYARTERRYFRLRKYMRHIMDVGTGKKTVELTRSGEIELCSGRAELGTVGGGVGLVWAQLVARLGVNWALFGMKCAPNRSVCLQLVKIVSSTTRLKIIS
ncbi:unnamed protein product [Phytophthora fragariaefolia]|uniref:Unnamed protein product n=1 Tax=Phytophthora fragariaefolia TaxID=1490495 RepID=A0A9W7DCA9_9STRA|nr:unnamed protein product [Phytophthora fragariaefolia]